MKHKRYKCFMSWQEDKEEEWLNEMSAQGLQLVDAGQFRFIFEDGAPGEYIYRMELLKKTPRKEELAELIETYKSVGAEYVDRVLCCIYVRRKASEGPFELYSDLSAKLKQNTYLLWIFAVWILLGLADIHIQLGRYNLYRYVTESLGKLPPDHSLYTSEGEIFVMLALIALGALTTSVLAVGVFALLRRRYRLKKEQRVRE